MFQTYIKYILTYLHDFTQISCDNVAIGEIVRQIIFVVLIRMRKPFSSSNVLNKIE